MKNLIIFIVLIFVVGCSLMIGNNDSEEKLALGIKQCTYVYEKHSCNKLPKEIDRVYILAKNDIKDLLFVKGAMGTFDTRDDNYLAYVACRISGGEVQYVQAGYYVLYSKGNNDIKALDIDAENVMEYLYKKKEEHFVFSSKQIFSADKLND